MQKPSGGDDGVGGGGNGGSGGCSGGGASSNKQAVLITVCSIEVCLGWVATWFRPNIRVYEYIYGVYVSESMWYCWLVMNTLLC